jgi:hypothetical protein
VSIKFHKYFLCHGFEANVISKQDIKQTQRVLEDSGRCRDLKYEEGRESIEGGM